MSCAGSRECVQTVGRSSRSARERRRPIADKQGRVKTGIENCALPPDTIAHLACGGDQRGARRIVGAESSRIVLTCALRPW